MPLRVGVGEDPMRECAAWSEFSCSVLSFAPVVLFDDDDWVSEEKEAALRIEPFQYSKTPTEFAVIIQWYV